ncbi:MAG: uroporphyrinogen decarboxylase [Myxococcota bacterium]|nr:uroporphyrinogen decarboxylase [Myxococcota bacterium]
MKHDSSLLVRALRGEATERPPVWFMRQAGRYLPEYREVRSRVSFLELCHSPELACEVTLQPLRRFGFDAGIIFSDILLPLEAMGADLTFNPGEGPRIHNPVRDRGGIAALKGIDPVVDLPSPLAAITMTDAAAGVPILGFAGAPFTLACYLVQGGGSKNWEIVKTMMWQDPEGFTDLLNKLADVVAAHLQAQVEAGAAAVQMFDTWAGALSSEDFRRFALPAAQRAFRGVKGPTLYFTKDSSPFLPWLAETGASAIGLDWRTDMARARAHLGDIPVQGNLDPIALHAPPEEVAAMTRRVIAAAGQKGHIFNLGHGCIPSTPVEGVQASVDAVKGWSW